MSKNSKDLFVLFLQVVGISESKIFPYFEEFVKTGDSMEEFSRSKLLKECLNIFLERLLIRFSKIYDDLELRERIEHAMNVPFPDVKGDLHIHTEWSDGTYPVELYAKKAEKMGYHYLTITDHSLVGKGIVQMDADKFLEQVEYVKKIQNEFNLRILQGVEIDINEDGTLDYPSKILEKADIVLGTVHFDYGKGEEKAFELLKSLLKNKHVNVIAHPLNKIGEKTFKKHLDEVIEMAKRYGKALEISLVPDRIQESDFLVENLKDSGVKFSFGTDSHSVKQLELMSISNLWLNELNEDLIANFYEDPIEFLEG